MLRVFEDKETNWIKKVLNWTGLSYPGFIFGVFMLLLPLVPPFNKEYILRWLITALIVPDYEALKEYADAHRIQYKDPRDLTQLKQIYEMLEEELAQFQRKLASYERVRKFTILEKPFTIEDGEMTPSLKLKRKVIEQRYSDLIEEMYEGKK